MRNIVRLAMVASLALVPGLLGAQSVTGSVTLSGTSNVHAWTATTSTITAAVSGSSVTVTVPVQTLNGSRNGMNGVMQRSLKMAEHPSVTFTTAVPVNYSGPVAGQLTVAGVTRPVSFTVARDGETLTGSAEVKMSDFGVRPPTAMLGTVRSGDAVTIRFSATIPAALR